jgi:hypothetical protein
MRSSRSSLRSVRPMRSLLALLGLSAVACGGGGGGSSERTLRIDATAGESGYVTADDIVVTGGFVVAGDFYDSTPPFERGVRGFESFDISSIPPTATVISATLRLTHHSNSGLSFAGLGELVLDEVVYGDVLDAGAYDRAFPVHQEFAFVPIGPAGEPTEIDVTMVVQSDLASTRSRTQFRVRFQVESNTNGNGDTIVFGENDTPEENAELVVRYE